MKRKCMYRRTAENIGVAEVQYVLETGVIPGTQMNF
jgi:hypothetical protein